MSQAPAFAYFLEKPSDWKPTCPGFEIVGWFYPGVGRECRDIRAVIDGLVFYGIYGLERPDVQQAFPDDPNALRSGFHVRAQFWSAAREVRLEYLDADDHWQVFIQQPVNTSAIPGTSRPQPLLRAAMVFESLFYLYRNFHLEPWSRLRKVT